MEKVILFGASKMGEIAFEKLKEKYNIVGFVDNDKTKQDTYFCGLCVYSPTILKDGNYNVIICSIYDIEISKQLIDYGVKKFYLFEINDQDYLIKDFNYSNIDDFSIKHNKISLLLKIILVLIHKRC